MNEREQEQERGETHHPQGDTCAAVLFRRAPIRDPVERGCGKRRPQLEKTHETCEQDHQAADPDEQIKGHEGDQSPSLVTMIQTDL
ncbi:MAG: hypothetical protein AAF337_02940 [Pseudomonadota bacterium]